MIGGPAVKPLSIVFGKTRTRAMKLLLIEDNTALQTTLQRSFGRRGFQVVLCGDGHRALDRWRAAVPDVVLLDLSLPGEDGLAVLAAARAEGLQTPVIILTARGTVGDRVLGLNTGADDYLAKPFHMEELLARLRGLLRRLGEHTSAQWQCGAILLDTRQARVLVDGLPLQLTSHEFKLLSLLMQRKGEVLSRTELSEHIYPQDADRDSNTIEVFVGRLRKKLPAGSIETVRGLGYRLVDVGHAA